MITDYEMWQKLCKNKSKILSTLQIKRRFCVWFLILFYLCYISVTNTRSQSATRVPKACCDRCIESTQTGAKSWIKGAYFVVSWITVTSGEGKPDIDSDLYIIHNIQTAFEIICLTPNITNIESRGEEILHNLLGDNALRLAISAKQAVVCGLNDETLVI